MSLSFDSRPLSVDAPAADKASDSKSNTIIFSTCGGEGHMIDFDAPDKNGTAGSPLAGASADAVLLWLFIAVINNDSLLQQDEPWSSMSGSVLAALSELTTSLCIMSHRKETMI